MTSEIRLFYSLNHNFKTSNYHPDRQDESWFIYMKCSECEHEESTNRDEHTLPEARIHRSYIDIPSIVDLLGKEYEKCEQTRTRQKYPQSHEWKSNNWFWNRIHIKKKESNWCTTGDKYEEEYEKISTHKIWNLTKKNISSKLSRRVLTFSLFSSLCVSKKKSHFVIFSQNIIIPKLEA